MNSFNFFVGIVLVLILLVCVLLGLFSWDVQEKVGVVLADTNSLKINDVAFADYVKANSQTLEYLNNNCKVVADNNFSTTLVCVKSGVK
jgi:hypothetical protein